LSVDIVPTHDPKQRNIEIGAVRTGDKIVRVPIINGPLRNVANQIGLPPATIAFGFGADFNEVGD
jgi:hypothetical protein